MPLTRDGVGRALSAAIVRQIEEILAAKASRTPSQRKVGSDLLDAARKARRAERPASPDGPVDASALAQLVEVDIRADVSPELLKRTKGWRFGTCRQTCAAWTYPATR